MFTSFCYLLDIMLSVGDVVDSEVDRFLFWEVGSREDSLITWKGIICFKERMLDGRGGKK